MFGQNQKARAIVHAPKSRPANITSVSELKEFAEINIVDDVDNVDFIKKKQQLHLIVHFGMLISMFH